MMNGRSKILLPCSLISFLILSCTVNKEAQKSRAKLLQRGRISEDTSFAYHLPYKKGSSHLLVQGYYSPYTHRNRVALDFKMKKRTKIYAARGGVVVRMNESGNKGGMRAEYRQQANYIVIRHEDGSFAGYWHLKKNGVLVNTGDTVQTGQLIGLSGNTGYTAFPHLHFSVWYTDENGRRQSLPTRFITRKKIKYLRPLHWYRNPRKK